jgi:dethiobiotin synthetase
MLLKAIVSNKIKLKKLIANIIQPLNANDKENMAILISRIKGEKYLVKKA